MSILRDNTSNPVKQKLGLLNGYEPGFEEEAALCPSESAGGISLEGLESGWWVFESMSRKKQSEIRQERLTNERTDLVLFVME